MYVSKKPTTTITIYVETKDKIDKLKIHSREPYKEVLERILKKLENDKNQ